MNPIVDTIMLILFVLFMVFIFGGYHKTKSAQREEGFRVDEEIKKKEDSKNTPK